MATEYTPFRTGPLQVCPSPMQSGLSRLLSSIIGVLLLSATSLSVPAQAQNDATLSGLVVSAPAGITLNPGFASGTTRYTVYVSNAVRTVSLTPTTSSASATLTVAGNTATSGMESAITLGGRNSTTTVAIGVTAQDGTTTETYRVTIERTGRFLNPRAEADFSLANPVINVSWEAHGIQETGAARWWSIRCRQVGQTTWRQTNVTGNPIPKTGVINRCTDDNGNQLAELSAGRSYEIEISARYKARAHGPSGRDFGTPWQALPVFRLAEPSDDADLSSIAITPNVPFDPVFSSAINQYVVVLGHDVSSVTLTPTASDAGATIAMKVGDAEAVPVDSGSGASITLPAAGERVTVQIFVTSETRTENNYTVEVVRRAQRVVRWSEDAKRLASSIQEQGTNFTARFAIEVIPPVSTAGNLTVTTTDASATSADYTLRSATIAVPAGASRVFAEVDILNDSDTSEDTESFSLALSVPTGNGIAAAVDGDASLAVSIVDSDGSLLRAPSPPYFNLVRREVLVEPASGTSILIRWAYPADDGGTPVTGYVVRHRQADQSPPAAWVVLPFTGITATSAIITGLTAGRIYEAQAAAINAQGTGAYTQVGSAQSRAMTPSSTAPLLPAPAGLVVQGEVDSDTGEGSITISWRDYTQANFVPTVPTGRSFNKANFYYAYSVFRGDGVRVVNKQLLRVPGNTVPDTRSLRSAPELAIDSNTNPRTFSYDLPGRWQPGQRYIVRVQAQHQGASGLWSNTDDVTLPPSRVALKLMPRDTEIDVSWSLGASLGRSGQSLGPTAPTFVLESKLTSAADSAWAAPAGYTDNTLTNFSLTGLVNGTSYDVRVAVMVNGVTGPYSTATVIPVATAAVPEKPGTPRLQARVNPDLSSFVPDFVGITVDWEPPRSDGGADISDYRLEYKRTSATDWVRVPLDTTETTNTETIILGLVAGISYDVRVAAINSVGQGPYSDVAMSRAAEEIPGNSVPAFASDASVRPMEYGPGEDISETLPAATGGNGGLLYSLSLLRGGLLTGLPAGLAFDPITRLLSGSLTTPGVSLTLLYRVEDTDTLVGRFENGIVTGDAGYMRFQIDILDSVPDFGTASVDDLQFNVSSSSTLPVTLPAVDSDGDGTTTYRVSPSSILSAYGLAFDPSTRVLSGTPRSPGSPTPVEQALLYIAEDADGSTDTIEFTILWNVVPTFPGGTSPALPVLREQTVSLGGEIDISFPAATAGNGGLSYALETMPNSLPSGIVFDADTLRVTGTVPVSEMETAYVFTLTVSDEDGVTGTDDQGTFVFTVSIEDSAPSFAGATIPDGTALTGTDIRVLYPLALPAATGGTGALTYELSPALPAGLSFDPATREIRGTPTVASSATEYTLTARDEDGDEASITFDITIEEDQIPSFGAATIPDRTVVVGTGYAFFYPRALPAATGGNGALTYELSPALPAFLSFDPATREIRGIPTVASLATEYTLTARDEDGDEASIRFDITVEADQMPSFGGVDPIPAQTAKVRIPFTLPLPRATGGNGIRNSRIVLQLGASAVADISAWGLRYDFATHSLTGTPTRTLARKTFRLISFDRDGDEASITFDVTIEANEMPSFAFGSAIPAQIADLGRAFELTLPAASGGDGALTYELSPALPAGLRFDPATRAITGTPTVVSSATDYTLTARDEDGDEAMYTVNIEVVDRMPSFPAVPLSPVAGRVGSLFAYSLPSASSSDGNRAYALSLRYTLSPALPADLRFDPATREITGTPTVVSSATDYTLTARDLDGDEASITFNIVIGTDAMPSFDAGAQTVFQYRTGRAVNQLLPTASGGDGTLTYTLRTALPSGLSFDAATRSITGTPSALPSGSLSRRGTYIWVAADEDGDEAILNLRITIQADTVPLFGDPLPIGSRIGADGSLLTRPFLEWAVGSNIDLVLPEAARGNGVLTYGLTPALPSGLTFDAARRAITGTTPTAPAAKATYTLTATDEDGDAGSVQFDIIIVADTMPSFDSATPTEAQTATVGIPFTLTLPAATGGNGRLRYSLTPALSAGLEFFAATRQIQGTPTQGSPSTTYTLTATDEDDDTATYTVDIDVNGIPSFLSDPVPSQTGRVGSAFDLQLPAASGSDGTPTYTLTPTLPSGLVFDAATRVLSGTPTVAVAQQTYTLTVADEDDDMATTTFSLVVEEDKKPDFGTPAVIDPLFIVDDRDSIIIPTATGGDLNLPGSSATVPLQYSLSRADGVTGPRQLPEGLDFDVNFDGTRIRIIGTPTEVFARQEYILSVRDADGDLASRREIFVEVQEQATPSFAGVQRVHEIYRGSTTSTTPLPEPLQLPAATGGNLPVQYSVLGLPAGLVFDAVTRRITGNLPMAPYNETAVLQATDRDGDRVNLNIQIQVEPNKVPRFNNNNVGYDVTYRVGSTISARARALPEAIEGNGDLMYSVSPVLPAGLVFDVATRRITGTPTAVSTRTAYTLTATDEDGDTVDFEFFITVEADLMPSYDGVTLDDVLCTATLPCPRVRLPLPTGGDGTPRLEGVTPALPDGLVFNALLLQITGTPTAVSPRTSYTLRAVDEDGDTTDLDFFLEVEADLMPSFGTPEAINLRYAVSAPIKPLQLPAASSGNGVLRYTVKPFLPNGLVFNTATRQITGTPFSLSSSRVYTLTATDEDDDAAIFDFSIAVVPDESPDFGTPSAIDERYVTGSLISPLQLPAASSGNGQLSYSLTAALPAGLAFDAVTLQITGTPSAVTERTAYTLQVEDSDGDTVGFEFFIETIADRMPDFGAPDVIDMRYVLGTAISPLQLPAASSGNGQLSYSLTPALPAGLVFNVSLRLITGTPSAVTERTAYTLQVEDSDGDTVGFQFFLAVETALLGEEVSRVLLPEMARASVGQAVDVISGRIEKRRLDGDGVTSAAMRFADMPSLSEALVVQGQALANASVNLKEILGTSGFAMPLQGWGDGDTGLSSAALWGSGSYQSLSGQDGGLNWDGDLSGLHLGADLNLTENLLAGMAISWSWNRMDYQSAERKGSYDLDLTSIYPYVAWGLGQLDLWATGAYGWGEVEVSDADRNRSIRSDASLHAVAIGASTAVLDTAEITLRIKTELLQSWVEIDAASENIVRLDSADVKANRWRFSAEASRDFLMNNGAVFSPSLELGARHDGGDGAGGAGAELLSGLRYTAPALGLTLEGTMHVLMGRSDYEEWGVEGSILLRQPGRDQGGLSLNVRPGYGSVGSNGGIQALWDHGVRESVSGLRTADSYGARINVQLDYGMLLAGGRNGLLVPYGEIDFGAANSTKSYRVGMRWGLGSLIDLQLSGEQITTTEGVDRSILFGGEARF